MATLDEIVAAAAKVFRTKGYHAATVRDIADEVGILKGSLYHHFESKEALLYLVVRSCAGQFWRIWKRSTGITRIFLSICASASR
jgi:AcrR family transcriptional regulator